MELKPGSRWKSSVCTTEVVVVRAKESSATIECGGAPMVSLAQASTPTNQIAAGFDAGTQVGKRYVDAESGVEMLCTKPGQGSLAVNGRLAKLAEARALPASD